MSFLTTGEKLVPSDICDSAVVVIAVGSLILISSSLNLFALSSLFAHTQPQTHMNNVSGEEIVAG